MLQFCANLSMMFNEVDFLARFGAAKQAGFDGVEFLFPYDHPAATVRERLDSEGLTLALFNMPPGDWAAGERGVACLPNRKQEFRDGVAKALDYAGALGCTLVHCMAGIVPPGLRHDVAWDTYVANLAWASERASVSGVVIALEPINHRDMPGFLLNTTGQAAGLVEALGRDKVGLQFDVYHCQVTEGDVTKRFEGLLPLIAHVQIADVPMRHEPGTGEIAWNYVFGRIEASGYRGWIGCEYRPAKDTIEGLSWRENFGVVSPSR